MNETIITSGKHIPEIAPHLELWGSAIALYLFIGGLAAGLIFFANYFYLRGKSNKMVMTVKVAPIIAPIIIVIGLILLVADLHHKLYFWQLLLHLRMNSPMSWGAWTLSIIMIPAIVWPLYYLKDALDYLKERNAPQWLIGIYEWVYNLTQKISIVQWVLKVFEKNQKLISYLTIYLAIILGVYTGILLSAFNARPLWNTAILGPLFLTSGISTGAALLIWLSKDHKEIKRFSKIDLFLIAVELFFIIHMFMGMKAGSVAQVDAAMLFLGGPYTAFFWTAVVGLGLLFPALLEILELSGLKVPVWIPAFFVLLGGLIFRFIMVDAGQFSSFHIL